MKIRVWKLGDHKEGLMPTEPMFTKLGNILSQWDGKSDLDLVWDSVLTVQEFEVTPSDPNVIVGPTDDVKILVNGKQIN